MAKRQNRAQTNFNPDAAPEPDPEEVVEETEEEVEQEIDADELPDEVVDEFLADDDFSESASTQIDETVQPELPENSPYAGDGFGQEVVSSDPDSEVVSEEETPEPLTPDQQAELDATIQQIAADQAKQKAAYDSALTKQQSKKPKQPSKKQIADGLAESTTRAPSNPVELLSEADCNAWCKANLLQITYSVEENFNQIIPVVILHNYYSETIGAGNTLMEACHAAGLRPGADLDPNETDPVDEP